MKPTLTFIHSPDPLYADNQNYGVEFMPLWVFNLSSNLNNKENYNITLYDSRIHKIDNMVESDIFIFSGINQDLHMINSVQENLRTRYPLSKFIIGGPITWSFHKAKSLYLLKEFDQIIIGDGEDIISEVIENNLNNKQVGKIINNEKRFPLSKSKSLDIPFMSRYVNHYYGAVVEVSRGCPFLCEFCDIRILPDNNKSHCKNPSLIGQDVENLIKFGKRQFIFACDNFIGDHVWAEKVVDELIRIQEHHKVYISIYTWVTINIYRHKRLLKKMRLAGFDLLFIGIESFNQNSLIETAKVQNTKLELVTIIKEIQSYGFIIVAGLIFGFDTDQENCFDLTSDGIKKSGLLSGDPSFLTALPGTPLYRRMDLSKRLRNNEDLISSASTGGIKYQTNIKYLQDKDDFVYGFLKFIQTYIDGKFQFQRLDSFVNSLNNSNFIKLRSSSGGFLNALSFVFKNPRSLVMLFKRAIIFSKNPIRLYFALRGLLLIIRSKHNLINQFMFWLFSWSNYVIKYSDLKYEDFDLDCVAEDFDYAEIIPDKYRELADEKIPKNKIDMQYKATVEGLSKLIPQKIKLLG